MSTKVMEFWRENRHRIVDIYIFINIAVYFIWNQINNWSAITWDIVEVSFLIHNIIMLSLFLIRKKYKKIDGNLFHQFIASSAFFSGLAFAGYPQTGGIIAQTFSIVITLISYILGIISLLNLGKSFGVLIANREIKTSGVYSIVRHPMYLTDILFRVGYVTSHCNVYTILLLIITSIAYIYRALLEEKFLSQDTVYADYMTKVKYRFIPFLF